jgi:hypothetical protein
MGRKKTKQSIEIDPRDPERELWLWALATSQQAPEVVAMHSRIAKTQRDQTYWENHAAAVREDHRRKREAWAKDTEGLDNED